MVRIGRGIKGGKGSLKGEVKGVRSEKVRGARISKGWRGEEKENKGRDDRTKEKRGE